MQHDHIAIFGSGVTARTLAHHLKTSSLKFTCFRSGDSYGPGLCSEGSLDNWTRLHHVFGKKHAQSLWDLSEKGFQSLEKFTSHHGIFFQKANRIRISHNDHEDEEMKVAHHLLVQNQIQSSLSTYQDHTLHLDRTQSAWVDEQDLLEALYPSASMKQETFRRVTTTDPLIIETSHRTFTADALVFTDHQDFIQAAPQFKNIAIPYVDQWHTFKVHSPWPAGTVFSMLHGAFWGTVQSSTRIHFGGARFLRPWNFQSPKVLDNIRLKLTQELEQLTQHPVSCLSDHIQMRCAPQDEYPLLGHWGQAGHIFIAMGWGPWNLSYGFAAGEIVAEILKTGTTSFPYQRFQPTRFQSY